MKRVFFWGWYSDYDCASIDSLKPVYETKNISMHVLLKLVVAFVRLFFPRAVGHSILRILLKNKLNQEGVVVFSDDIIYYSSLHPVLPLPRKIVVFRNKIPKKMYGTINSLRDSGYELYTFDESDANFLKMDFCGQYIPCTYEFNGESVFENKAYFLGLEKGRKKNLDKLAQQLKKKDIVPDINIVKKYKLGISFYLGKKSYKENLRQVNRSKYIIDIVQEEQVGLTLRALESLFYGRKLITNNSNISNYNFYNPNNILILDTSYEIPEGFINSNYEPVGEELLRKYRSVEYYSKIIGPLDND